MTKALFPVLSDIKLEDKVWLDPLLKAASIGISEFTFANLYLFRKIHAYQTTTLQKENGSGTTVITGSDEGESFFMIPFALPTDEELTLLFRRFGSIKNASCHQAVILSEAGYRVEEDRNNFDYIYLRRDLATLAGRRYAKKRNLIKQFNTEYHATSSPLNESNRDDALWILDRWVADRPTPGDYDAARDALISLEELGLFGTIYHIDKNPAAFTISEILPDGKSSITHFEKSLSRYRGLAQYVNRDFASTLPDSVRFINREQDLGEEGLRQAKESYKPLCFLKKFRVYCDR